MKKYLFFVLIIFISSLGFAQEVEKIFETDEVKYKSREPARFGPYGICINEVNDLIEIMNGSWEGSITFNFEGKLIRKSDTILPKTIECYQKINNLYIGSYNTNISIEKDARFLAWVNTAESGISFILKKDKGYIVYYVDKNGIPGGKDIILLPAVNSQEAAADADNLSKIMPVKRHREFDFFRCIL